MKILRPAILLMNRLSYPFKMGLLSSIFAVPLLVFVLLLVREINADIEVTNGERAGIAYNRQVVDFSRDILQYRGLFYARLKGETGFADELERIRNHILVHQETLDALADTQGTRLGVAEQWLVLRNAESELREGSRTATPEEIFIAFSDWISQIHRFIRLVSDRSALTLDPQMESYYLADILFSSLPAQENTLGQIRGLGTGLLASDHPSASEISRLSMLLHVVELENQQLLVNLEKVFGNRPAFRARVAHQLDQAINAVHSVQQTVARISVGDEKMPPADYFQITDSALQSFTRLADTLTPLLVEVLNQRANELTRKRLLILIFTLVSFSTLLYLFMGNYRSVTTALDELVAATRKMAGGDLSARARVVSEDEMAMVAVNFNDMAGALEESLAERDWAEEALRKSEESLRAILASAADAIITMNQEGRVLSFNPAAERIFGYTRKEIIGQNVGILLQDPPSGGPGELLHRHSSLVASDSPQPRGSLREETGCRQDGTLFPLDMSISEVRVGDALLFTCIIRDISERKRSEQQIRDLAKFPEENPSPVMRISGQGTLLYANKASRPLLRLWACEVGGPVSGQIRDLILAVLAAGRSQNMEIPLDNQTLLCNAVPVPELDYVNLYGQDISDRIKAEQVLKESEKRFRRAVENAPFPIMLHTDDGKVEAISAGWTKLSGYSLEEIPTISAWTEKAYGEKKGVVADRIQELFFTSGPVDEGEYTIRTRKGSERVWDFSSAALGILADGRRMVISMAHDVTEREKNAELIRRRQQEIEELNATLEQRVEEELKKSRERDMVMVHQARLAAMGEMIGNIAHQWRQPLNALSLLLVNIREAVTFGEMDQQTADDFTAKGGEIISRMSTTIDDFRNFFKPDKEKELFTLSDAVRDALNLIEAGFAHHHITVTVDKEEEVEVLGFHNEFSQVILNLLGNSRDAVVGRNRGKGDIRVTIRREGENGMVLIRDNGGGIAGDALDRIFEPYFSTKEEGKGTGIGLYMSKMIVEELMHGRIQARNTGEGAEFAITVPLDDTVRGPKQEEGEARN